ncbi:hypothetical protein ACLKA7_008720 [Drosophila subpalustris]
MLPAILECGIYKIESGPFNGDKVLCLFCSPNREFVGNIKQTGNLHRHVKNCHPELLQKIKDKKNEQLLDLQAQRNERRRSISAMLPAILECGIFKITAGPFNGVNVMVLCLICSPKRELIGSLKQTGNLHRHVKNRHPEMLHKIKDRRNEQSLDRRAYRNERRRSLRTAVVDKVEVEE